MDTQTGETKPGHLLSADRVGHVQPLHADGSGSFKLTPETNVLCCNRGREVVKDTHNSKHYQIQPGYFTTEYGAAVHFQRRAVVPGSRNPETGFQASFIVIIGVASTGPDGLRVEHPIDDVAQWDPFTDEECREYSHALEALDRANMINAIDPEVQIEPVAGQGLQSGALNETSGRAVASRVKSGTVIAGRVPAGRRSAQATRIEGPGAEALKTRNAAGTNEAIETIAQTRAEQQSGGGAD